MAGWRGSRGLVSTGMDIYEVLYTTRAMRRVRPDPIPYDVQARMLDAAVRAPSASDQQSWRFLFLDDPAKKSAMAALYQQTVGLIWDTVYKSQVEMAASDPDSREAQRFYRFQRSVQWLADHFAEVPLFLYAFVRNDPSGGSIYPSVWSAMLAARSEGVGSCLTAILQSRSPTETLEILEVPADEGWSLAATVSFGYPMGKWAVAPRLPAHTVAYRNTWGSDVGFTVPEPLWMA